MNNKIAKRLKKKAEAMTVGKLASITRKTYKELKKKYKATRKNYPSPKIKMSRRKRRLSNAA